MALIISPSGNFYGSEQVLWDYLHGTRKVHTVAVPRGSMFHSLLLGSKTGHNIIVFNCKSVQSFYFKVFWWLLTNRYNVVYVNEAGHSKYLVLLAKIFRKARYFIHVRIVEDTDPDRWPVTLPPNLRVLTISKYIERKIPFSSQMLYDLYDFPDKVSFSFQSAKPVYNIAIIGRVAYSKGFIDLANLIFYSFRSGTSGKFFFNVYGDVGSDISRDERLQKLKDLPCVCFHGFVEKGQIYLNNDIVLHLSETEPLGRVFFEAIAMGKPFVGFDAGGIGEIAQSTGLSSYMVDPGCIDRPRELLEKLNWVIGNGASNLDNLENAFKLMREVFSKAQYINTVDNLLENAREQQAH